MGLPHAMAVWTATSRPPPISMLRNLSAGAGIVLSALAHFLQNAVRRVRLGLTRICKAGEESTSSKPAEGCSRIHRNGLPVHAHGSKPPARVHEPGKLELRAGGRLIATISLMTGHRCK
jgi:hypothetical protein